MSTYWNPETGQFVSRQRANQLRNKNKPVLKFCHRCDENTVDFRQMLCEECKEHSIEASRIKTNDLGVCRRCRKHPRYKTFVFCKKCTIYNRERQKVMRHDRIKRGLCPACGVEKPMPNGRMCERCLARYRRYYKTRNERKRGQLCLA